MTKEECPRQEGISKKQYQYHRKDPLSSSVIYLEVGLSYWSCVVVAHGNAVTPTIDTISHDVGLVALLQRHRRECEGEYQ